MEEHVARWARRIVVAAVVVLPAIAALLFLAVQVSSQPPVCGTCHNMRPYYESWQHSSHHDVPCVECHIPPGIESEIRKKYEALSMVTSYFTGTYGGKPWGDVTDASCLRSGCHSKRLLLGRELYGGVLFDHQPHLAEMRRDKQLRCTSCHSQIVQGEHIAVTPTTCFLCHFKNVPLNEDTGRCVICHDVPEKTITTRGLSFDHGEVKRVGMDCTHCHEGVVRGGGEVPRERCLTCHNQPARLERYTETGHLHRTHVTERSVECLDCHIEITHGIPAHEESVATACDSCHTSAAGHAAVRDLYRGIGAHGVTPLPAPMYFAGIRCEACHNVPQDGHSAATEVSCMACHGPRYLTIYRSWQAGLSHRMEGVTAELATLEGILESAGKTPEQAGLADAKANLACDEDDRSTIRDTPSRSSRRRMPTSWRRGRRRARRRPPCRGGRRRTRSSVSDATSESSTSRPRRSTPSFRTRRTSWRPACVVPSVMVTASIMVRSSWKLETARSAITASRSRWPA
jgi:cytochrome c nitrite reductase small subunit